MDIILFFLIPNRTFFSMGRLYQTGNYLNVECFTAKEVSFVEARYDWIKIRKKGRPVNFTIGFFVSETSKAWFKVIPMALNAWTNLIMARKF